MSVAELVTAREKAPRSLAERAYELLVREITRLELAPGEVLADKTLTERFDIGRTPMREALQRLAREGLVVHARTAACSSPRSERGERAADLRVSLADRRSCRAARGNPRQRGRDGRSHRSAQGARRAPPSADDIDTYVVMDRLFYEALAQAAQNVYLAEVIPANLQSPPASVVLHLEERSEAGIPSRAPTRK